MAGKQNWKVKFLAGAGIVKFLTRADDVVRQEFDVNEVHANHQDLIKVRGLKVPLEERTSDIPGGDIERKMKARHEVFEQLKTENWAKARTGGGFGVRIEIEALANLKGITIAQARASLAKLDEATQEKILSGSKVQAEVQALQAGEEIADLDDLLDD